MRITAWEERQDGPDLMATSSRTTTSPLGPRAKPSLKATTSVSDKLPGITILDHGGNAGSGMIVSSVV